MNFAPDNDSSANNANPSTTENSANHSLDNEVPEILNNYVEQSMQTNAADEERKQISVSVAVEMSSNAEEKSQEKPSQSAPKENQRKRREKPKDEVTFRTHLTSLAHVSVVVFVYIVLKLAFRGDFVFFTWHPILMAIGWMLLMTEGFYAINKYNTYWRFKTTGGFRVKIHVAILSIGYILAVIGFIIVYINKDNNGKSHFVSWHGLLGLIGLVSTFPPVINGFVLWYRKELEQYIPVPKLIKFIHVSCGVIAFTFGALSLVLSVYTRWFGKKSNHSEATFYFALLTVAYPLVWAIYGPMVKLVRFVKEQLSEAKDD